MLNESVKPAEVLTEETIQKFDEHNKQHVMSYAIDVLIKSHRSLNSRNAKLVHENDELMAENEKLKSALSGIVNGGWSSYLDDDKLRVWQTDRINPKQIALDALEELNHE